MGSEQVIFVAQGECKISDNPLALFSTVLGSCVAACMWDGNSGLGGMNHFLLPHGPTPGKDEAVRYGIHSMELLTNGLLKRGAERKNLRAKLFGGATMAANLGRIGELNASFARDYLSVEDIPCVAEDLGGTFARRVIFYPANGQARVLRVRSSDVGALSDTLADLPEVRKNDIVLF